MKNLSIAIVVSSALIGCVEDGGELGEGEQAVSRTVLSSRSCAVGDLECHWAMGAGWDGTCALAGVSGSLVNGYAFLDPNVLWLSPGLTAAAACFAPAQGTSPIVWTFGSAPAYLGAGANRQCVLDGIDNNGQALQSDTDYVAVYQGRGGGWYLGGNLQGSGGHAWAHCFDVTTRLGNYNATSHGSTVIQLLASNAQGGVVCGLTKLGGRFTSAGDSIAIDYDAPSKYWIWTLTGRKTAEATCFR